MARIAPGDVGSTAPGPVTRQLRLSVPPPSLKRRLIVAAAVAIAAGMIAYVKMVLQIGYPSDFSYFWVGSRALLDGQSPYAVVQPGGPPFNFESGYLYPLPAALLVAPLALLPVNVAGILFAALGMAVLAFAISKEGFHRLPILMSFPALWCMSTGQWASWVAAAALVPSLGFLAAAKPNLGLAAFLYRPTWRFLSVAVAAVVVSLIVMPGWPAEWLSVVRARSSRDYQIPVLQWQVGGPLLLLAAMRWRLPEGRLLLGMACVPQTMLLYDQIALGLVARTRLQAISFGLWSYVAPTLLRVALPVILPDVNWSDRASAFSGLARIIVLVYYLPLLGVVLARPNAGRAPAWLDRAMTKWPVWFRGTPAEPET
jgi:hypothetical protein